MIICTESKEMEPYRFFLICWEGGKGGREKTACLDLQTTMMSFNPSSYIERFGLHWIIFRYFRLNFIKRDNDGSYNHLSKQVPTQGGSYKKHS